MNLILLQNAFKTSTRKPCQLNTGLADKSNKEDGGNEKHSNVAVTITRKKRWVFGDLIIV